MNHGEPGRSMVAGRLRTMTVGLALAGVHAMAQASNSKPPPVSPLVVPGAPVATASPVAATVPLKKVTDAALADAVRRTGKHAAEFTFVLAEPVTWSDGSLGCPEEGMGYTDALVRGFRVRIGTSAKDWLEYHAGMDGKPFLCPPERIRPPAPDDGT